MEKGDIKAIVDSRLDGEFDSNSVWKVLEIAVACVSPNSKRRPTISVIVTELKESLTMELARNTYTRDSIKLVTMNLNTEFIPQYKDDVYDRFWSYGDNKDWTQINASIPADALDQNIYKPPAIVMSTAVHQQMLVLHW
ncbi:hypothetical protein Fmac_019888 [Flemingia macrophylla]|uniref:Malectin-like domain-containing protein n=1 Tax=Flemingia macrophylla TaxID=520843 RepID=A0ABD1M949_9FABA